MGVNSENLCDRRIGGCWIRNAISYGRTCVTLSRLVRRVRAMILYKYAIERYRLRGINMEQWSRSACVLAAVPSAQRYGGALVRERWRVGFNTEQWTGSGEGWDSPVHDKILNWKPALQVFLAIFVSLTRKVLTWCLKLGHEIPFPYAFCVYYIIIIHLFGVVQPERLLDKMDKPQTEKRPNFKFN